MMHVKQSTERKHRRGSLKRQRRIGRKRPLLERVHRDQRRETIYYKKSRDQIDQRQRDQRKADDASQAISKEEKTRQRKKRKRDGGCMSSNQQRESTREAVTIGLAEKLWKELGLSYTPKFHAFITHARPQMKRLPGFGGMLEDHVERSHQYGDKHDHQVARLKSPEMRAASYSHYEKTGNDPQVVAAMAGAL
jgi:hypothetical protein